MRERPSQRDDNSRGKVPNVRGNSSAVRDDRLPDRARGRDGGCRHRRGDGRPDSPPSEPVDRRGSGFRRAVPPVAGRQGVAQRGQGQEMNRADVAWRAGLAAAPVISRHKVSALPGYPRTIPPATGIDVRPMPPAAKGVSGMLLRVGDRFGIAYANPIDSPGFQNFSIAHELGHYFLEGHVDAVLAHGGRHESHAGFGSDDPYEIEADYFAAA